MSAISTACRTRANAVPSGNWGKAGLTLSGSTEWIVPSPILFATIGVGKEFSFSRYSRVALRPPGRLMKTRKTERPEKKWECCSAASVSSPTETHAPSVLKRSSGRKGCRGSSHRTCRRKFLTWRLPRSYQAAREFVLRSAQAADNAGQSSLQRPALNIQFLAAPSFSIHRRPIENRQQVALQVSALERIGNQLLSRPMLEFFENFQSLLVRRAHQQILGIGP